MLRFVLDDFNREGLGIEADRWLPSARVIRSLEQIIEWRGSPSVIRCDNSPEYISEALRDWARSRGIRLEHIQPGKPQQNAYVERYNRTVRYDWLSQTLFESIAEAQDSATRWLWTYNNERPNMAIGGITPIQRLAMAAWLHFCQALKKGGLPQDFTNRRYRFHGTINEAEKAKNRNKSRVRAKVEHVFGVIKNIFGFRKVCYRGLAKNLHRLEVTAALTNLYLVRRRLLAA